MLKHVRQKDETLIDTDCQTKTT